MGHLSDQQVIRRLKNAAKRVEEGAIYYHYKVLHLAFQESAEKVCVVYQALYGSKKIWVSLRRILQSRPSSYKDAALLLSYAGNVLILRDTYKKIHPREWILFKFLNNALPT